MILNPFTAPVHTRLIKIDNSFVSNIFDKMLLINGDSWSQLSLIFLRDIDKEEEEENSSRENFDVNLILNLLLKLNSVKNTNSERNNFYLEKNINIIIENYLKKLELTDKKNYYEVKRIIREIKNETIYNSSENNSKDVYSESLIKIYKLYEKINNNELRNISNNSGVINVKNNHKNNRAENLIINENKNIQEVSKILIKNSNLIIENKFKSELKNANSVYKINTTKNITNSKLNITLGVKNSNTFVVKSVIKNNTLFHRAISNKAYNEVFQDINSTIIFKNTDIKKENNYAKNLLIDIDGYRRNLIENIKELQIINQYYKNDEKKILTNFNSIQQLNIIKQIQEKERSVIELSFKEDVIKNKILNKKIDNNFINNQIISIKKHFKDEILLQEQNRLQFNIQNNILSENTKINYENNNKQNVNNYNLNSSTQDIRNHNDFNYKTEKNTPLKYKIEKHTSINIGEKVINKLSTVIEDKVFNFNSAIKRLSKSNDKHINNLINKEFIEESININESIKNNLNSDVNFFLDSKTIYKKTNKTEDNILSNQFMSNINNYEKILIKDVKELKILKSENNIAIKQNQLVQIINEVKIEFNKLIVNNAKDISSNEILVKNIGRENQKIKLKLNQIRYLNTNVEVNNHINSILKSISNNNNNEIKSKNISQYYIGQNAIVNQLEKLQNIIYEDALKQNFSNKDLIIEDHKENKINVLKKSNIALRSINKYFKINKPENFKQIYSAAIINSKDIVKKIVSKSLLIQKDSYRNKYKYESSNIILKNFKFLNESNLEQPLFNAIYDNKRFGIKNIIKRDFKNIFDNDILNTNLFYMPELSEINNLFNLNNQRKVNLSNYLQKHEGKQAFNLSTLLTTNNKIVNKSTLNINKKENLIYINNAINKELNNYYSSMKNNVFNIIKTDVKNVLNKDFNNSYSWIQNDVNNLMEKDIKNIFNNDFLLDSTNYKNEIISSNIIKNISKNILNKKVKAKLNLIQNSAVKEYLLVNNWHNELYINKSLEKDNVNSFYMPKLSETNNIFNLNNQRKENLRNYLQKHEVGQYFKLDRLLTTNNEIVNKSTLNINKKENLFNINNAINKGLNNSYSWIQNDVNNLIKKDIKNIFNNSFLLDSTNYKNEIISNNIMKDIGKSILNKKVNSKLNLTFNKDNEKLILLPKDNAFNNSNNKYSLINHNKHAKTNLENVINEEYDVNFKYRKNTIVNEQVKNVEDNHIRDNDTISEQQISKIINETVEKIVEQKLNENKESKISEAEKVNNLSKKVIANIERNLNYEKRRRGLI